MKGKSLLHSSAAVLGVLLAVVMLCTSVLALSEAATEEPVIRPDAVQFTSEEPSAELTEKATEEPMKRASEEISEDPMEVSSEEKSTQPLLYVNGTVSAAEVFDGVLYADVAAFCAALHLCSISADYAFVHVYNGESDLFAWVGDDTLSFGDQSIAVGDTVREIDGAPAVPVIVLVQLFGLDSDGGNDDPIYVTSAESDAVQTAA